MQKVLSQVLLIVLLFCQLLSFPGFGAWAAEFELSESHEDVHELNMFYDDRLDLNGKEIDILDEGTPDSFQVGFGIEPATPDDVVIRVEGDALVAAGTGHAKVLINGEKYLVSVQAAPISLFLLIGQSNMEGAEADPSQSIVCPAGQVYATYGDFKSLSIYSAQYFVPSALTGQGSLVNTNGTDEFLSAFPVYSLTEKGDGKIGPDSGIAYEWNKITGEKVWVVNAAHSGAELGTYQKSASNYEEAVQLFSTCQQVLMKEIQAGHYTLSHMGYFWCHGCSDSHYLAEEYVNRFLRMHENLKQDLSADMDGDPNTPDNELEFANIILALAGYEKINGYRRGIYTQPANGYFYLYPELEMRGHRVAQLWMGANPELPDIHVVCNIADNMLWMPDGYNGVADYFAEHYPGGRVDYPTQEEQPEEWYSPKLPTDIKNFIHYRQIGYNELGIEAARNTCILLGYAEDTDEKTTVRFVNWTGYEDVLSVEAFPYGKSSTLVVPVISPVYRAKSVEFQVTDGLKYDYYDLIAEPNIISGTLTAILEDGVRIKVEVEKPA